MNTPATVMTNFEYYRGDPQGAWNAYVRETDDGALVQGYVMPAAIGAPAVSQSMREAGFAFWLMSLRGSDFATANGLLMGGSQQS